MRESKQRFICECGCPFRIDTLWGSAEDSDGCYQCSGCSSGAEPLPPPPPPSPPPSPPLAEPPPGTTSFSISETGWCMSWLNDGVGWTDSAEQCWNSCEAKHGNGLVAIDWWPADTGAQGCWCQNECLCMDDHEIYVPEWGCNPCLEDTTGGVTIMRSDVAMPHSCVGEPHGMGLLCT